MSATARDIILGLERGEEPAQVFGPERPQAAHALYATLLGIIPTPEEVTAAAFGYGPERKIKLYRLGRTYLHATYPGYTSHDALPAR